MFQDLLSQLEKSSEQDFRLHILNALLQTPHRKLEPFVPLFAYVHKRDPIFFAHLASWYFDNGTVRDLKQLFIAFLVSSDFSDEFRSAGLALLLRLAPYEVERVLRLVKGYKENGKQVDGVAKSAPRSLKTTIEYYLRERESNKEAFDNTVLHARKPLKTLYASLRIRPGTYAQKVLFDNDPPADSRLYVLKLLAKAQDASEQAILIAEHNIPYRVAVSALKELSPAVLAALLCNMTPQEVINNLANLKKRGVMDNSQLRSVVEAKLSEGQSDKRVSALKTRRALQSANLDEEMQKRVEAVGDQQIKSKARIKKPTALHIDKSGSMEIAIELGKAIAAMIAPICEAGLFVYAFDTMAYQIQSKDSWQMSDWEKAFKGIIAGGGTSCGVALELMRRNKQLVEQIIMVTDQEENNSPYLATSLKQYAKDLGVLEPQVIIVNVGQFSGRLERSLAEIGLKADTFSFNGDYYSLPSLLPMLAGGSRLDLLMEIMSCQLPQRKLPQVVPV